MAGIIYAGILVDRVLRVTGDLIGDEQRGFRAGRGCIDHIFSLKQRGKKAREKKCRVHVGFIDLEKANDRLNREVLRQVFRIYDVVGKMLSGIKSMYVDNLTCVKVQGMKVSNFG